MSFSFEDEKLKEFVKSSLYGFLSRLQMSSAIFSFASFLKHDHEIEAHKGCGHSFHFLQSYYIIIYYYIIISLILTIIISLILTIIISLILTIIISLILTIIITLILTIIISVIITFILKLLSSFLKYDVIISFIFSKKKNRAPHWNHVEDMIMWSWKSLNIDITFVIQITFAHIWTLACRWCLSSLRLCLCLINY